MGKKYVYMILHFVPWQFLLDYNNIFFTNKGNLKIYIFKQSFSSCHIQIGNKSNVIYKWIG